MIANERHQKILDYLAEKKNASVNELLDLLKTSDSTLRRDLMVLESQGKCERVHGGVSLIRDDSARDRTLDLRRNEFHKEKLEIGAKAVELVQEGDLIYVDAGTTTEAMLSLLADKDVAIVTNSINHASIAARKELPVTLVGGQFKSLTDAIVGEEALEFLDKYTFDIGFIGTNAISKEGGLLTPDIQEAAVKKKAMNQSRNTFVLADSSKLDKTSKIRFGTLDQAVLICEKDPKLEQGLVLEDWQEKKG